MMICLVNKLKTFNQTYGLYIITALLIKIYQANILFLANARAAPALRLAQANIILINASLDCFLLCVVLPLLAYMVFHLKMDRFLLP